MGVPKFHPKDTGACESQRQMTTKAGLNQNLVNHPLPVHLSLTFAQVSREHLRHCEHSRSGEENGIMVTKCTELWHTSPAGFVGILTSWVSRVLATKCGCWLFVKMYSLHTGAAPCRAAQGEGLGGSLGNLVHTFDFLYERICHTHNQGQQTPLTRVLTKAKCASWERGYRRHNLIDDQSVKSAAQAWGEFCLGRDARWYDRSRRAHSEVGGWTQTCK